MSPLKPIKDPETRAKLAAALGTLEYPISKDAAVATLRGWEIPTAGADAAALPLSDVLKGVSATRFRDATQATRLVERRWGAIAKSIEAVEAAERAAEAERD